MKIKTFAVNPFEMNCFICWCEGTGEGVIIDPGVYEDAEKKMVKEHIMQNDIKIKFILNTHGHIDHVLGNKWAKEEFNVPVMMHKEDVYLLERAPEQGKLFGISVEPQPQPDKFIDENDKIEFGNVVFEIVHTPGHSPGGITFVDNKSGVMIAGDCIFRGSIGRYDLWKADLDELLDSINNKILTHPDNYKIYPGHYEPTSVKEEKANNPYLS